MKTAIYPGTFDPITYGHIDVIKKSLKVFDRVVVATTDNINKNYYFSIDERLSSLEKKIDLLIDLQFIRNAYRYQKFYKKFNLKYFRNNLTSLSNIEGIHELLRKRIDEKFKI